MKKSLKDKILTAGVENCVFVIKMRPIQTIFGISFSIGEKYYKTTAKIDEKYYKIKKDYKITLVSVTPELFGKCTYYMSDLESIINEGNAEFFIKG